MPHAIEINSPLSGTLADAVRSRLDLTRPMHDALLVLLGALVVAATAQVAIPMPGGVPITGQTFGVLLVGAALGWRLGITSMFLYLGAGVLGAPVFAGGLGGPQVLAGPTAGYLVGFVLSAGLVGLLAERAWDRSLLGTLAMMTFGTALIFLCGVAWGAFWIMAVVPVGIAETSGPASMLLGWFVLPYLPGAAIKIALAMALLPGAWRLIGRDR